MYVDCTEKEILDEMRPQGVTAVKRFKVKRDGQLKDINTFVFTFNTPVLPSTIKFAFLKVNVEIYIPNPLRCFNCQQHGLKKIDVRIIPSVPDVVNLPYFMKPYAKIQLNVPIMEKLTMLTLRSANLAQRERNTQSKINPYYLFS